VIDLIKLEIKESIKVKQELMSEELVLESIYDLILICINALEMKKKIIFCGNGGSFADAQHLTAEFISKLRIERSPLPALALGTNSSNLSAISNDYGYEKVFERELMSLGNKGDIFIPISTSGNSINILKAVKYAKSAGIETIGLTGKSGGEMSKICRTINVPSDITEKIQESHIMIGHIICGHIEKKIFSR
jgi:D-sedoheptulose 7-phosphate isomerase